MERLKKKKKELYESFISDDLLIGELPERIVNTNTSDSVIKVLRMEIDRIWKNYK